jgi:hypothetical protein
VAEEPDNDAENQPLKTEPEKRRILLSAAEQTVEVEGPDDIETMAQLAAYFWLLTSPADKVRFGFSAGSSLVTERAEPYTEGEEGSEPCT